LTSPLLPLLLYGTAPANAEVRRFALVVANNEGAASAQRLYFAEQDALKMQGILARQGQVAPDDLQLVLGGTRTQVLAALGALKVRITQAEAAGDDTILTFYYSGHADDANLEIGRTTLAWTELADILDRSGADVRIAFVDACQSGQLTRRKGGTLAPSFVFEVQERLDATGSVYLTSSASDESSQESDSIGGSYFTHFLASALSGTADDNRDGRVTLSETYRYVYHQTVIETSDTRGGTQHPTYDWELSGTGDVIVAELPRAGGTLTFSHLDPGTFTVFDPDRHVYIAEVEVTPLADSKLAVAPGHYLVQRRYPTWLEVRKVTVAEGTDQALDGEGYQRIAYANDTAKGLIDADLSRAKLPRVSVRGMLGGRGFLGPTVPTQYLPNSPLAGVEGRFNWHKGPWASLDLLAGSGVGELTVTGLDYPIRTNVSTASLGVGLGYATPEARFRVGGGLHVESLYISRSFPDAQTARQSAFGIAPGLEGWAGWYPRHFEVEFEMRTHYLPYIVDDQRAGMLYSELALALGWRF